MSVVPGVGGSCAALIGEGDGTEALNFRFFVGFSNDNGVDDNNPLFSITSTAGTALSTAMTGCTKERVW
jgi:hypothetical protein